MPFPRLLRSVLAVTVAATVTAIVPVVAPAATAACATSTGKSISGTVVGQDGRDVNVSIGFDLVDSAGRAINGGSPGSAGYGCAKTGGYSVAQSYLNHFVGPLGREQAQRSRRLGPLAQALRTRPDVMRDGTPYVRTWRLDNVPSNAVGAYLEIYHRGYRGSPCKDSQGNYCFNPENHTKYGNANEHIVPIGTRNLAIRLPMTCAYGGTAGALTGRTVDGNGRSVEVADVVAFTEARWNGAPALHGWGIATRPGSGRFEVAALASGQTYVLLVTRKDGSQVRRSGIRVDPCTTASVDVRV